MSRRSREIHVYKEAGGRRWSVDVNTHARNGRIRSKNSYGNESARQDRRDR